MSETTDRQYRVTWRSILPPGISNTGGSACEVLEERTVTAAYYRREDDRYVFKRADGMQSFDIAADLVETIEIVEVKAGGADANLARNLVEGTVSARC